MSGKRNTEQDTMDITQSATLTADEAHEIIGKKNISRGAWYAAIKRGEIPAIRIGRRVLIPRHALQQFLRTCGGRLPSTTIPEK